MANDKIPIANNVRSIMHWCHFDVYPSSEFDEEFSAMHEQLYRVGQGFVAYSITNRSSFEEIATFRSRILVVKDRDYYWPMIIVGNHSEREDERQVSIEGHTRWKPSLIVEGLQNLAKRFRCQFYETSAINRVNVDDPFYSLVREIRRINGDKIEARMTARTWYGRKRIRNPVGTSLIVVHLSPSRFLHRSQPFPCDAQFRCL